MNLVDLVDKDNKRTGYEWNNFLLKYGPINNYDDLSEEGKQAACNLAEKQADRFMKIIGDMR